MKKFISTIPLVLATVFTFPALAADQYIEFCTGDKYLAKHYGDGNPAGHALVYVNGLCKDYSKEFPQVKPCSASDNHEGVGISLDAGFKNVNWIAVPTRELALFGDYGTGRVDDSTIQNIMNKTREYEVFKNVEIDPKAILPSMKDYTSDKLDQYTLYAIGTDLAFNTARNMYCLKTKIGDKQIADVTKFLNSTNKRYYTTDEEYQWSISDNCTHLSVNTVANAGVGKERKVKTKRTTIGNILNITLPKSEILKSVRRANKDNFSPNHIWKNKKLRNFFEKYGRLPYSYGNLVAQYAILKENDFFNTQGGSFISLPVIGMSLKKATKDENVDTKTNLLKYKKAINKALSSRQFSKNQKNMAKKSFLATYKTFLENDLKEIKRQLTDLYFITDL